jgi:hypothetical protein
VRGREAERQNFAKKVKKVAVAKFGSEQIENVGVDEKQNLRPRRINGAAGDRKHERVVRGRVAEKRNEIMENFESIVMVREKAFQRTNSGLFGIANNRESKGIPLLIQTWRPA